MSNEWPVSLNQERWLVSAERAIGVGRPVVPFPAALSWSLSPATDVEILRGALRHVAEAHWAFQTAFVSTKGLGEEERRHRVREVVRTGVCQGGLYRQVRVSRKIPDLEFVSLAPSAVSRNEDRWLAAAAATVVLPSDHRTPLYRVVVVRGAQGARLLMVAQHVVVDWLSLRIVGHELEKCYRDIVAGRRYRRSYRWQPYHYAQGQQRMVALGVCRDAVRFWRGVWQDGCMVQRQNLAVLEGGQVRVGRRNAPSGTVGLPVPRSVWSMVKPAARSLHVTRFAIVLAAFVRALETVTGQSRVAVWINYANRVQPQAINAVGWFTNAHMHVFDAGRYCLGADLVGHVYSELRNGMQHQTCPLGELWRAMRVNLESRGRRVIFDMHTTDMPIGQRSLLMGEHPVVCLPNRAYLDVRVYETPGETDLYATYASEVLEAGIVISLLHETLRALSTLAPATSEVSSGPVQGG